jgi:hypothetical protein
MRTGTKKSGWIPLVTCLTAFIALSMIYAQESKKKVSSYMPVVITEDFATIMARMKAAKPEIMKPQTEGY